MEQIKELVKGVATSPLLAFLLIIFLVQSWIMVNKLDAINETLLSIHKDNVVIQSYITEENESTKDYLVSLDRIEDKIEELLFIIIKSN